MDSEKPKFIVASQVFRKQNRDQIPMIKFLKSNSKVKTLFVFQSKVVKEKNGIVYNCIRKNSKLHLKLEVCHIKKKINSNYCF